MTLVSAGALDRIFKSFHTQFDRAYTTRLSNTLVFDWAQTLVAADARCRCRVAGSLPGWSIDWVEDEAVGVLITCSICGSSWSRLDAVPHKKKRKRRRRSC